MEHHLTQGLVQVYTGDGKGKTTAALGLALRAAGQGLKVFIFQFLKPAHTPSGEAIILASLSPQITLERLQVKWWSLQSFKNKGHIAKMKKIVDEKWPVLKKIVQSGQYDLIIFDEINNCLFYKFIDISYVLELLSNKPKSIEIVLTGRNAPQEIINCADLVTEMKMIKHPFTNAVTARKGIEY